MTDDDFSRPGHAPVVRVIEQAPVVHVRANIVVDGRRLGYWQHVEGAYTTRACDCSGYGHMSDPQGETKPCPRRHDLSERYRNNKGWLCCHMCERLANREYARKRRAVAA